MKKICVIGSANVDLIARVPHLPQAGETILGHSLLEAMGGKGANQAVAAARLGAEVQFIGRVGDDDWGRACRRHYEAEGINCAGLMTTPGTNTGLALIGVGDNGENNIIVISGANQDLRPADLDQHREIIQGADVVLLQLEIPLETVYHTIDLAAGRKIILNPAPYQALDPAYLKKISVLVLNLPECEALLGNRLLDDYLMGQALLSLGLQGAVVTLGAQGALAVDSLEWQRVPGHRVKVVDSTGAGDCFCGALAVALAQGGSLLAATHIANAAAALSVGAMGAQTALPKQEDVIAFLNKA